MTPAQVAFVVGLVLAIAGAAVLMVARFKAVTTIDWRPLGLDQIQVSTPEGLDTDRLVAAIAKAKVCLCAVWDAARVQAALADVKIRVELEPAWYVGGSKVAGVADPQAGVVTVGRDLSALCHEFAHVAQWRIDRRREDGHVGWVANGIEAATGAYLAWLKS